MTPARQLAAEIRALRAHIARLDAVIEQGIQSPAGQQSAFIDAHNAVLSMSRAGVELGRLADKLEALE